MNRKSKCALACCRASASQLHLAPASDAAQLILAYDDWVFTLGNLLLTRSLEGPREIELFSCNHLI